MLTVVVSSYESDKFETFKQSLENTIGYPFEIIKIDNPGLMSICRAYNSGASKGIGDYFLFVHEDVTFITQNWGALLIQILNQPECGLVGVAGSDYYGYVPAPWWFTSPNYMHLIQGSSGDWEKEYFNINFSSTNEIEKVKMLDGVFLSCRRDVFEEFKFDETIEGFHGYDSYFSMVVSGKYQNYVTNKFIIRHSSLGKLNSAWLKSTLQVRNKLEKSVTYPLNETIEIDNWYRLVDYLKSFNLPMHYSYFTLFNYFKMSFLLKKNVIRMVWYSRVLLKR